MSLSKSSTVKAQIHECTFCCVILSVWCLVCPSSWAGGCFMVAFLVQTPGQLSHASTWSSAELAQSCFSFPPLGFHEGEFTRGRVGREPWKYRARQQHALSRCCVHALARAPHRARARSVRFLQAAAATLELALFKGNLFLALGGCCFWPSNRGRCYCGVERLTHMHCTRPCAFALESFSSVHSVVNWVYVLAHCGKFEIYSIK